MLDIGGASSHLGRALIDVGATLLSVDPDTGSVEFAREHMNIDARIGSLPDKIPAEPATYDIITLLDVIEHIDDAVEALGALQQFMKDDALLLITVPALQWLWSTHNEVVHHRRRYDAALLRNQLEAAGFRCLRISYWSSLLLPAVAAQRLVKQLKERLSPKEQKPKYHVKTPSALLNRLFGAVMSLERRLLRRVDLPLGSSLLRSP